MNISLIVFFILVRSFVLSLKTLYGTGTRGHSSSWSLKEGLGHWTQLSRYHTFSVFKLNVKRIPRTSCRKRIGGSMLDLLLFDDGVLLTSTICLIYVCSLQSINVDRD